MSALMATFICALAPVLPFSGFFHLDTPRPGELLISEIMADPSPGMGSWPECEYLELYNPTERILPVRDVRLKVGNRTVLLPDALLPPGGYLLLCPKGQSAGFGGVGMILELASFPALSNTGAELSLSNAQGQLLEHLVYMDSWYRDAKKKNGGWSLERIRSDHPVSCATNWQSSRALSGGTPGSRNMIAPADVDTTGPKLLQVLALSPYELRVTFDEVLGHILPAMFELRPFLPIVSVQNIEDGSEALIMLGRPMVEGAFYVFMASAAVPDCVGNPFGLLQEVSTGIPAVPGVGDIIVNEILFEAAGGGEDFIELFNPSEKIIGLEGLTLRNTYKTEGVRETYIRFPWILLPGQYLALSSYPAGLRQRYVPPDTARITYAPLPTLQASQGNITLLYSGVVLESVNYSVGWHHPLLKETRGVSLERVFPSTQASGWHSSAKGATPGYRNSQFFPEAAQNTKPTHFFELESPVFSPDGDGYQDEAKLLYRAPVPGYLATIRIFDANGRGITEIANNNPLSAEGEFYWDGSGYRTGMGPGVYVIWVECFHPDGARFVQKMTCVWAGSR